MTRPKPLLSSCARPSRPLARPRRSSPPTGHWRDVWRLGSNPTTLSSTILPACRLRAPCRAAFSISSSAPRQPTLPRPSLWPCSSIRSRSLGGRPTISGRTRGFSNALHSALCTSARGLRGPPKLSGRRVRRTREPATREASRSSGRRFVSYKISVGLRAAVGAVCRSFATCCCTPCRGPWRRCGSAGQRRNRLLVYPVARDRRRSNGGAACRADRGRR